MKISPERQAVIDNIGRALEEGNSFKKVEISDPAVSDEEARATILPYDLLRKKPINKIKAYFATKLAESLTKKVNKNTEIFGLEHANSIKGGAIITANHYNPTDSTPIRMMANLCDMKRKLYIVVQETNIFMQGTFGFLMKNCNTLPTSRFPEYMAGKLKRAIGEILARGDFILIYPEQEMWFNYKKPRAMRDGAFHWAAQFGVPILPTFTEMQTEEGEPDGDGFYPVKHTLHVLSPIYPDGALSVRENRVAMQRETEGEVRRIYEQVYGIPLDEEFVPKRDISGIL